MRFTVACAADAATATIANGQSLSGAIDCGGLRLFALVMPASWTSANLTLQVSTDGTTYSNLYDANGNEYTITAAASRAIIIDGRDMAPFQYFKLRSGTAASAVTQGADRAISCALRSI